MPFFLRDVFLRDGAKAFMGSIPGSGRSPGGRKGNPLQHSYLESPMDRGAWWTHPQAHKNRTQLSAERCPQMWPREREAARLAVSSGFITRWGWTQLRSKYLAQEPVNARGPSLSPCRPQTLPWVEGGRSLSLVISS